MKKGPKGKFHLNKESLRTLAGYSGADVRGGVTNHCSGAPCSTPTDLTCYESCVACPTERDGTICATVCATCTC